ncbi:MAG: adenine phosphoribosyltransferase [Chloroflexi bacterium]|nr:adenine phosphoribosyltransferase [Chloroflexota bacterium]MBU1749210.1 adenine phosphoribosyltransferase [Chloroflexota bacterium]MBU1878761.1 adenine phosphoribosyltransferase [Chloroflexota bacterium]
MAQEVYPVEICGIQRDFPLFEVAPGVKIAIFNMLGDAEFIKAVGPELAGMLPEGAQVIVTAEVKSIPLAYEVAAILGLPYVVLRKVLKPYMVDSLGQEVISITTGKPQMLWLDGKDREFIKGKKVAIVDDVISTGSTLEGMRQLIDAAGGEVIAEAAVFTEGDPANWEGIIALGNLPVFTD